MLVLFEEVVIYANVFQIAPTRYRVSRGVKVVDPRARHAEKKRRVGRDHELAAEPHRALQILYQFDLK